jgi:hypothetical protein
MIFNFQTKMPCYLIYKRVVRRVLSIAIWELNWERRLSCESLRFSTAIDLKLVLVFNFFYVKINIILILLINYRFKLSLKVDSVIPIISKATRPIQLKWLVCLKIKSFLRPSKSSFRIPILSKWNL